MPINPNIFRAYDIRGKYPLEINEKVIEEITQCLGRYFKLAISNQQSAIRIIVGHDARLSSPALYKTTIAGLQDCRIAGLKIIKIGLATTPMLTFLVNHFKADGGIMITASHNPKEYNGLKVVGKNAEPIGGKEIYKIMTKS